MKENCVGEQRGPNRAGGLKGGGGGQGIQSTHNRPCNIPYATEGYKELKLKNNQKGKPGFTPISFFKRGTEWRVQENSLLHVNLHFLNSKIRSFRRFLKEFTIPGH